MSTSTNPVTAYRTLVRNSIEDRVQKLQGELDEINVTIRRFLKTYMATDGAGHIIFRGPTDKDRVKLARQLRRMEDKRDTLTRMLTAAKAEHTELRSKQSR